MELSGELPSFYKRGPQKGNKKDPGHLNSKRIVFRDARQLLPGRFHSLLIVYPLDESLTNQINKSSFRTKLLQQTNLRGIKWDVVSREKNLLKQSCRLRAQTLYEILNLFKEQV